MGIDDFMTFCRLIGAEPYIAVNTGLGDDHSAAEEVENRSTALPPAVWASGVPKTDTRSPTG